MLQFEEEERKSEDGSVISTSADLLPQQMDICDQFEEAYAKAKAERPSKDTIDVGVKVDMFIGGMPFTTTVTSSRLDPDTGELAYFGHWPDQKSFDDVSMHLKELRVHLPPNTDPLPALGTGRGGRNPRHGIVLDAHRRLREGSEIYTIDGKKRKVHINDTMFRMIVDEGGDEFSYLKLAAPPKGQKLLSPKPKHPPLKPRPMKRIALNTKFALPESTHTTIAKGSTDLADETDGDGKKEARTKHRNKSCTPTKIRPSDCKLKRTRSVPLKAHRGHDGVGDVSLKVIHLDLVGITNELKKLRKQTVSAHHQLPLTMGGGKATDQSKAAPMSLAPALTASTTATVDIGRTAEESVVTPPTTAVSSVESSSTAVQSAIRPNAVVFSTAQFDAVKAGVSRSVAEQREETEERRRNLEAAQFHYLTPLKSLEFPEDSPPDNYSSSSQPWSTDGVVVEQHGPCPRIHDPAIGRFDGDGSGNGSVVDKRRVMQVMRKEDFDKIGQVMKSDTPENAIDFMLSTVLKYTDDNPYDRQPTGLQWKLGGNTETTTTSSVTPQVNAVSIKKEALEVSSNETVKKKTMQFVIEDDFKTPNRFDYPSISVQQLSGGILRFECIGEFTVQPSLVAESVAGSDTHSLAALKRATAAEGKGQITTTEKKKRAYHARWLAFVDTFLHVLAGAPPRHGRMFLFSSGPIKHITGKGATVESAIDSEPEPLATALRQGMGQLLPPPTSTSALGAVVYVVRQLTHRIRQFRAGKKSKSEWIHAQNKPVITIEMGDGVDVEEGEKMEEGGD